VTPEQMASKSRFEAAYNMVTISLIVKTFNKTEAQNVFIRLLTR
jgi:hypothetical protein